MQRGTINVAQKAKENQENQENQETNGGEYRLPDADDSDASIDRSICNRAK